MVGINNNFKSKRLICAWHLQRNFASKFASVSKQNQELYEKILNLPFVTMKEKFDETIKELKKPNVLNQTQLQYLDSKIQIKSQWAKCLIKEHFAVGVSTTSRIESMHHILAEKLNSNSRLSEVLSVFKEIEKSQISKFKEEFSRHKKKLNNQLTQSQLTQKLSEIYTPYALKKLEQKFSKCLSYTFEQKDKDKWLRI